MECQDFLKRYSEFRDRDEADSGNAALEEHLEDCGSCRRYHRVVVHGVELARSLRNLEPRADFEDRLRHRIYHADLMDEHRRREGSSPLVALALAAAAVLAGVGAWSSISTPPVPTAQLPGITAATPAPLAVPGSISLPVPNTRTPRSPTFLTSTDLWSRTSALLYEHSTLYHRYREGNLVRTGLH